MTATVAISKRSRFVVSAASVYVLSGGLVTLLGWIMDRPRLTDWNNTGISMFPNTAICAVLSAVALLLLDRKDRWRWQISARVLASTVTVIGVLTLVEHIFAVNLGIDTVFFNRPWGQAASAAPMRMGPPASVSFSLFGTALFLATCSFRSRQVASFLAIITVAIASMSVVGYWFGADQLFGVARLTGIALQASTMLAVLGVGLTIDIPEFGLMAMLKRPDVGGFLARKLLLPIVAIPLMLGWLRVLGQQSGLFDTAFGAAAMALTTITLLVLLLSRTATSISRQAQKAAIAEQRLSEQAKLLEAIDDAIYELDPELCITSWNEAAERMFGYKAAEVLGRKSTDVLKSNVLADQRSAYMKRLEQGEMIRVEVEIRKKDGSTVWSDVNVIAKRNGDGSLRGFVSVNRDITERKRATEAEGQARRAAEESSRAKDEFLAMLSHELRNPLNAILGWAVLLKTRRIPSDKMDHALEVIERNARAEAQLVESLLDLSRITAGKLKLDKEQVELSSAVHTVVDSLRPAAEDKDVQLDIAVLSGPVVVIGDADRLRQIFSNLLTNAVKFTFRGGHVQVRVSRAGAQVQIEVIDDGEGIHGDFLPHVFDRFRQAENTQSRAHGGLGLGLTIVRELVHAHGGSIAANSQGKGRGSTFTVTLPIPAVIPAHIEAASLQRAHTEGPPMSGLRILVVDDDADAREMIALALQSRGAVIQSASSAAEALDAIGREKPDVMIADIGMPHEDGYMLIQKVRALERDNSQPGLPAIALTAYASAADRDQALAAGFDLHLRKPVGLSDLTNAVAKSLKTQEA